MEEVKLSENAQAQEAAMEAATQRIRAERLALDEKNKALEALLHRKEQYLRHLEVVLAQAQAEKQALDAEHQRIREMSPVQV